MMLYQGPTTTLLNETNFFGLPARLWHGRAGPKNKKMNNHFSGMSNINSLSNSYNTLLTKNQKIFEDLCNLLNILFKKEVTLVLTRIKRPYFDVNMLALLFYKNTQSRRTRFFRLISLMIQTFAHKYNWAARPGDQKINLKSYNATESDKLSWSPLEQDKGMDALKGFRVKLGGRLLSQKIIPRISSKTYIKGKLARGKVHFTNTSRIYNKHKRGAYSITITTSLLVK